MQFFARLALISSFTLVVAASAFGADKGFSHQGVAEDAKRYETFLKTSWKPTPKAPFDVKAEAEKVFATDARAASRYLADAVVANDKDAATWTRLAQALLAI